MNENDVASPGKSQRSHPATEESYGIPESVDGMLTWEFVAENMASDRFYWITTIRPDGKPHARPTWGVWLEDTFYCGGERTRWVRNLATNPEIVVHREDAEAVVILEGTVERIVERHGGEIWLDSEPGEGSTFSVTLLAADDRAVEGSDRGDQH